MIIRNMWPGFVWAAIVFVLCIIPADLLKPVDIWNIDYSDKLAHAGVFAILTLLIYHGAVRCSSPGIFFRNPLFWTILSCILYGGLIELIQGTFIPNRTADIFDFVADTIGVGFGTVFAKISEKVRNNLW